MDDSRNWSIAPLASCLIYARALLEYVIFTALHEMQTRSSDENSVRLSVCPSVRLSVTRVYCDKTVERSVQIFIPYEITFSLVF